MTTFRLPIEMLALPLCGDDKRCVHFRIIHNMTSTGVERQFGFAEYLYCEIHRTWHEQKHNAYIPLTEWSKLVSYSQYVATCSKPIVDIVDLVHVVVGKKSNDGGEEDTAAAEPQASYRKTQPFPEHCDGHGCGCVSTGTPLH